MILYKCDRCGKIQKKPFRNHIEIMIEKEPAVSFKRNRMFCDSCAKKLSDWFVAYQEGGEQNDN